MKKKILLKFYEWAYKIEIIALKNGIITESELYDIRFQIQQEHRKNNVNKRTKRILEYFSQRTDRF